MGLARREAQIVFYLHLPLQIKWMPNRKSSKWTSAQYLREYAFRYRKHIDPGTEIILLLEDQAPEDLEQTLLFLQQQHHLKLTVHRRLERLDLCRLSADPISEGKVSQ